MACMRVPVLFITGPAGVGKSTVALEASVLLRDQGIPHAVIDIDTLARFYPVPADDPYRTRLALQNLGAIWPNFVAVGAQRLILPRVLEDRSSLDDFRRAVPGAEFTIVRLRASAETLRARVLSRERGSKLHSTLRRSAELAPLLDRAPVEDHLVETDGLTAMQIAGRVLACARWL
jgi:adenylylsulfate kinase